ncbi:hypothetical protein NDU88_007203 [Pleurodeles waltl]|uniref:SGNH hydrolase-type esterase domain-containing protein n=1 Tax=Pleurodeles waltl TaxID=8319 RepID=A0AAV7TZ07_PLEWA|nr:hypothetical protein NDU88_007203 [Pleurodeles waltl]
MQQARRLPPGGTTRQLRQQGLHGSVPGPEVQFISIWVVGHSFVKWASRQARSTPLRDNLGLDRGRYRVRWDGQGGMRWSELAGTLQRLQGRGFCPDVLLVHLGKNDIVKRTGLDILWHMKQDLSVLHQQWQGCHVVWTAFIPRRVWRGVRKPGAVEKARRKINKEMRTYCSEQGFTYLEHTDIRFEYAEFFRGDGVHLSFVGMELYLLQLKEVVKRLFNKT